MANKESSRIKPCLHHFRYSKVRSSGGRGTHLVGHCIIGDCKATHSHETEWWEKLCLDLQPLPDTSLARPSSPLGPSDCDSEKVDGHVSPLGVELPLGPLSTVKKLKLAEHQKLFGLEE